ncbi:MAG: ABC transporter ATP-binding protein [Deltaproteobacteria bacterium]|nr:ABC transporter ATP-binding protein [Deltaproteobacteria bacterium]
MTGVHVQLTDLTKGFRKGDHQIVVFEGVNLELAPGERVALLGPSGAGKSTFLHLLGMLDRPSAGEILLNGRNVTRLPDAQLHRLRNRTVGFVFQAHNLLAEYTALENVMVPVRLGGGSVAVAKERANALLRQVGLEGRASHRPGELSGGEQQRVALARALVMGPGLFLADEPTGNLDPLTATGVFELMLALNQQLGSTLVVVTHSVELAAHFPRVLELSGGRFREVSLGA